MVACMNLSHIKILGPEIGLSGIEKHELQNSNCALHEGRMTGEKMVLRGGKMVLSFLSTRKKSNNAGVEPIRT